MSVTQEYIDYVIDQLAEFGAVTARRMFGGAGLYAQARFFGLIADDVLYFKVDEENRKDYLDAGMEPFRPFGTHAMGYYEVPAGVLEDPEELALWAGKSLAAAGNAGKAKSRKRTGTKKGRKKKAK